jgi:legumain
MKTSYVTSLALFAAVAFAGTAHVNADNWAVVVAGSNGYMNYRHHADVCHAYQILKKQGIPDSNIIMMFYDDVANAWQNKFKGKLFNKPTSDGTPGVDVYEGCLKDYTGSHVTYKNFLDVLQGNEDALKQACQNNADANTVCSGKVLKSGPNDRVFINFADHGGTGLIAFPSGGFLHADDLLAALTNMHNKSMYKELVFYMEACESGSMFENLPDNLNIFATTAANGKESSWGTYCPPHDVVNGKEMNTCLGDLYSVNWMEDSDKANMKQETLQQQYTVVKQETNKSHVMEFGTMSFNSEPIGDFQSEGMGTQARILRGEPVDKDHFAKNFDMTQLRARAQVKAASSVSSRDTELVSLFYTYLRDQTSAHAQALMAEVAARERADKLFAKIAATALPHEKVEDILFGAEHKPSLWACHKAANNAYQQHCGGYTDYSLKYTRAMVNMCEIMLGDSQAIVTAITDTCA